MFENLANLEVRGGVSSRKPTDQLGVGALPLRVLARFCLRVVVVLLWVWTFFFLQISSFSALSLGKDGKAIEHRVKHRLHRTTPSRILI